jgi:AcrR family transcriptional regulator
MLRRAHSRQVRTAPPSVSSTRERILEAAALRFSRYSYEQTGLRDIAADVGVDVAYVHRCFGSKERLFSEALRSTIEPDRLLAGSANSVPGTLASEVLSREAPPGAVAGRKVAPLDIIVRSLSSPEAAHVLREVCLQHFVVPLARKFDEPSGQRAALIAALMVGVGILREVLCVEPLIGVEKRDVKALIATAIKDMIRPRPRRRTERRQQRTEALCDE